MKKILLLGVWIITGCSVATDELERAGNKQMNERNYEGAINFFDKAIAIDPDNYMVYYDRGLAKGHLGRNNEAIKDFSKAIKINQNFADLFAARANSEYALHNYQDAIADFDASLKIKPVFEFALYKRGCSKAMLKKYQEAIEDFTSDIDISKYDTDVHEYRAMSYTCRGFSKIMLAQKDSACVDLHKAVELGDTSANFLIRKYCY